MAVGLLIAAALLEASGWVLWQVLRQQGRLLLRLEVLEAEQPVSGLPLQSSPQGPVAAALMEPPMSTSASAMARARRPALCLMMYVADPVGLVFAVKMLRLRVRSIAITQWARWGPVRPTVTVRRGTSATIIRLASSTIVVILYARTSLSPDGGTIPSRCHQRRRKQGKMNLSRFDELTRC